MVLEEDIPQFIDWLPGAFLHWLLAIGFVAVVGLVVGYVVAVLRSGPGAGTTNFRRTLLDALADIFQTSLRRVRALTRLAIQESLHRMVLVAFAVFVLVLLFGAWYLDTTTAEPAKLYLSVVLTTTSYLSLLLALFLSVFSLPSDIENRTIHTVVTKPVRTSEIILGRVLGFSAVGTVMLTVTGVISYVFVVRGLGHTHQIEADSLVETEGAPGGEFAVVRQGRTTPVQNHRHQVTIQRNGTGRSDVEHGHWHEIRTPQRGDGVDVTGQPRGALSARVPVYGKLEFRDSEGRPAERGINVGDEWTYHSYIEGGSLAAAIWRFDAIGPDVFPDGELPLELTLQVFRTHKGEIEQGVLGAIVLRNPETKLASEPRIFQAKEFSADLHRIPRDLQDVQGRPIDLFDDLVANERLEIEISCLDRSQYFGMGQADAYLRAADASFTLNFIKGYVGTWLQMILLIGFGVLFSTFLSSAVAMLATLAILLGGFFTTFIGDLAAADVIGGGPVESLVRIVTQNNLTAELDAGVATTVVQTSDDAARLILGQIRMVLPDLASLSDAKFVANGFSIPGNLLWIHAATTLGYLVPVLVLAFFLFKAREVAG